LSARVALVTGASRGIGAAIARALADDGCHVVAAARSADALQAVVDALPTPSLAHVCDLATPGAASALVEAAVSRFGRVDIVVNNAGATPRGDFLAFDDAAWDAGFALKFFGAMRLCRAAWPSLVERGGCIVNIAGIGGRTGNAEFTIGGSVNAALLNLTKALADRGVRDGVRVNAINPGSIATERLQTRIRSFASEHGIDPSAATHEMARAQRVARFGKPTEIASAVAFLASAQAQYCQGAILDVDGGQTRTL
jgi:3-oxoacyl-[acyl-carrier protein] reductase